MIRFSYIVCFPQRAKPDKQIWNGDGSCGSSGGTPRSSTKLLSRPETPRADEGFSVCILESREEPVPPTAVVQHEEFAINVGSTGVVGLRHHIDMRTDLSPPGRHARKRRRGDVPMHWRKSGGAPTHKPPANQATATTTTDTATSTATATATAAADATANQYRGTHPPLRMVRQILS